MLTRAPIHPPREVCEREYRPNLEAKTEAEGHGKQISKECQKETSIKKGASQLRKANEKPRPAPSLVFMSSHQRGAKCCH